MFGMINFENGALGQWVYHYAGHGQPFEHRMVFGTRGSIAAPGDRNGRPVRLSLDDGTDIQRRAHPRVRAELPAVAGRGGALRRRARLDLRLRLRHHRSQDHRARVPRVRRVHPHRRPARGRRRGREARHRDGLRAVRVADRRPARHDRGGRGRQRSTPTSARSTSTSASAPRLARVASRAMRPDGSAAS